VYYAMMALALAGIALCFLTRVDARWQLLLGMVLLNTLILAPVAGFDRYRYPTMPYFAVFAGVGIAWAFAFASNIRAQRVTAPLMKRSLD